MWPLDSSQSSGEQKVPFPQDQLSSSHLRCRDYLVIWIIKTLEHLLEEG